MNPWCGCAPPALARSCVLSCALPGLRLRGLPAPRTCRRPRLRCTTSGNLARLPCCRTAAPATADSHDALNPAVRPPRRRLLQFLLGLRRQDLAAPCWPPPPTDCLEEGRRRLDSRAARAKGNISLLMVPHFSAKSTSSAIGIRRALRTPRVWDWRDRATAGIGISRGFP